MVTEQLHIPVVSTSRKRPQRAVKRKLLGPKVSVDVSDKNMIPFSPPGIEPRILFLLHLAQSEYDMRISEFYLKTLVTPAYAATSPT
jgi:hypothetical protein